MNLSTKSGTNSWHGSGYEYFRNKVLNANEYFNKASEIAAGDKNTPPPWTQNQYGFQVGGPVIKDKTFFYVSWEQYRQRTGSPFTTTVPADRHAHWGLLARFALCQLPTEARVALSTAASAAIRLGSFTIPIAATASAGAAQRTLTRTIRFPVRNSARPPRYCGRPISRRQPSPTVT